MEIPTSTCVITSKPQSPGMCPDPPEAIAKGIYWEVGESMAGCWPEQVFRLILVVTSSSTPSLATPTPAVWTSVLILRCTCTDPDFPADASSTVASTHPIRPSPCRKGMPRGTHHATWFEASAL